MIDRLISLLFFAALGLLAFVLIFLVVAAAWWVYKYLPPLDVWKRFFPGTDPHSRPLHAKSPDSSSSPTTPEFSSGVPPTGRRDRYTAGRIAATIEEERQLKRRLTAVIVVVTCLVLAVVLYLLA